jgi:hypothetical protein
MEEKYTISFRYGDKIITPKQENTAISSMLNNEDLFEALIENNISLETKLKEVIIYRPNFSVAYLSTQETLFMKESGVPLTIKNGKEEKTLSPVLT